MVQFDVARIGQDTDVGPGLHLVDQGEGVKSGGIRERYGSQGESSYPLRERGRKS